LQKLTKRLSDKLNRFLYNFLCYFIQNTTLNASKRNAKCTKTQRYLHQNARLNAAKREVKCTKTQD